MALRRFRLLIFCLRHTSVNVGHGHFSILQAVFDSTTVVATTARNFDSTMLPRIFGNHWGKGPVSSVAESGLPRSEIDLKVTLIQCFFVKKIGAGTH